MNCYSIIVLVKHLAKGEIKASGEVRSKQGYSFLLPSLTHSLLNTLHAYPSLVQAQTQPQTHALGLSPSLPARAANNAPTIINQPPPAIDIPVPPTITIATLATTPLLLPSPVSRHCSDRGREDSALAFVVCGPLGQGVRPKVVHSNGNPYGLCRRLRTTFSLRVLGKSIAILKRRCCGRALGRASWIATFAHSTIPRRSHNGLTRHRSRAYTRSFKTE